MAAIVILEGPDGSGKSTLAKYLSDNLGEAPVLHQTDKNPILNHLRVLSSAHSAMFHDDVLIVDRWYLSEVIYGPTMRGECYSSEILEAITEFLGLVSSKVVHVNCYAPSVQIGNWRRRNAEGKELVLEDTAYRLIESAYAHAFSLSLSKPECHIPKQLSEVEIHPGDTIMRYDYTRPYLTSPSDILAFVQNL